MPLRCGLSWYGTVSVSIPSFWRVRNSCCFPPSTGKGVPLEAILVVVGTTTHLLWEGEVVVVQQTTIFHQIQAENHTQRPCRSHCLSTLPVTAQNLMLLATHGKPYNVLCNLFWFTEPWTWHCSGYGQLETQLKPPIDHPQCPDNLCESVSARFLGSTILLKIFQSIVSVFMSREPSKFCLHCSHLQQFKATELYQYIKQIISVQTPG